MEAKIASIKKGLDRASILENWGCRWRKKGIGNAPVVTKNVRGEHEMGPCGWAQNMV